jgi:hypothetical protein
MTWPNDDNGDMAKMVPGCDEPSRPLAALSLVLRRALWLGLSVADRLGLRVDRLGLRVADRLGQHLMKLSLGLLDYLIAHRSPPVTVETTVALQRRAPQGNLLIKLTD